MEGREPAQPVAATRIVSGADVNYGALTTNLLNILKTQERFAVHFSQMVTDLQRRPGGGWRLEVKDEKTGARRTVDTHYVFLGAGGAALTLLQKSGIPEGKGFAGFPVSGIWLRCGKPELADRHIAKVYGMAAAGSVAAAVALGAAPAAGRAAPSAGRAASSAGRAASSAGPAGRSAGRAAPSADHSAALAVARCAALAAARWAAAVVPASVRRAAIATASAPRRDRVKASPRTSCATRSASSVAASAVAGRRTGAPPSPRAGR